MRKNYEKPIVEINEFDCMDIITASGETPVGFSAEFTLGDGINAVDL